MTPKSLEIVVWAVDCIGCPSSGAGDESYMVNLHEEGKRFPFNILKRGDGEARYSRQTSVGGRFVSKQCAAPEDRSERERRKR
jgi:hypothetical protein